MVGKPIQDDFRTMAYGWISRTDIQAMNETSSGMEKVLACSWGEAGKAKRGIAVLLDTMFGSIQYM